MNKKFLTLLAGATLCSLVVGGVAQTNCVQVTLEASSTIYYQSHSKSNICDNNVIGSWTTTTTKPLSLSAGSNIIVKSSQSVKAQLGSHTVPSTNATLDCTRGILACVWSTSSN
jgi:hypothetical protein